MVLRACAQARVLPPRLAHARTGCAAPRHPSPAIADAQLKIMDDALGFMQSNVVQGKLNERGNYGTAVRHARVFRTAHAPPALPRAGGAAALRAALPSVRGAPRAGRLCAFLARADIRSSALCAVYVRALYARAVCMCVRCVPCAVCRGGSGGRQDGQGPGHLAHRREEAQPGPGSGAKLQFQEGLSSGLRQARCCCVRRPEECSSAHRPQRWGCGVSWEGRSMVPAYQLH